MEGTLGAAAATASLLLLLFATTCCLSAPGIHHRLPTLTLRSDAPYLERKHKTVMRCVVEWPGADPAVVGAIKLDDVKWMKDGTPIAELDKTQGSDDLKETGAELRVLHGKRQSEGDFQCSGLLRGVQLGDGRAVDVQLVSAPVKVKRARLSKFERLSKEEEVHAIQGHVARLPCSGIPDSIPGPAIIWFERAGDDRRLGVEERKNRYLGTASGLQIAVVQPRDAGKYFCVATNPYTNQTRHSKNAVNLVVDDRAPTLSSSFTPHFVYPEPTKTHMVVEVAVGHSALLECVVAGGKVVWEKVNASLPVSLTDDGARVRQVWGNLRINEVSVDDAGTYVCHALSPIANADLSHPDHPRVTYKLHVYAPTAAKLLIEQQADSAWLLSCEAKNMAWEIPMVFINGLPLVDAAEKLGVLPGTNFYSNPVNLTIAAHTSLSGAVQCLSRPAMAEAEVYGDAVQRGDAFNIFVEERPPTSGPIVTPPPPVHLIDTGPENATRSEGATVQLICFVSSAVVSVEWLKGDTTVDLNVNERVRLVGTATLEIADIRKSDEGRYTCVAIDAAGHRASAAAHLTVEAAEDDFYDEAWNSKDEDEFEKNVSTSPTSATSNDEANAEENIVESAEEEEEPISTPTPVSTIVLQTPKAFVSGQNVRIQWSVPPPAASRLDAFKVQLRRDDPTAEWIDTGDRIESHVRAYTVHGLVPGIKYKFRIGAIAGQATVISDATDWIAIEAVEPKIRAPDPAVIVSLEPLSSEALLLSWSHTAADSAAEVTGFEIGYRSRPSTRDRNNQPFETINAGINEREHILDALLPSTTYEVYIVAVNKAGRSAKSNMKHASTTSRAADDNLIDLKVGPPLLSDAADNKTSNSTKAMGNGLMSLLQDWSTQVVLIFLGSVLIVLVFTLCCCMFCCTLRQRHATKVTNAAKGKFLDTSHRIFKEQRVHKGKLSLYHEVMIAGMKEDDEERPVDERSPLRSQAGTTDAGGHHQSASVASLKSFPFPQTHSPVIPNLYGDGRLDDADTSLDDDDPLNTTHGVLRRPADIGSFERYSPASDLQLPPPPNATSSPTRLLPYYQTSSGGSGRDEIAYSPPTSMDRSGRPPSHSPLFVSSVDGGDVMYNSRGGSSRNSHNSSGEHQRLHTFKPNTRSINDSILVGSFERSRNNPQGSPARLSDD